jgi:hypothetical protein
MTRRVYPTFEQATRSDTPPLEHWHGTRGQLDLPLVEARNLGERTEADQDAANAYLIAYCNRPRPCPWGTNHTARQPRTPRETARTGRAVFQCQGLRECGLPDLNHTARVPAEPTCPRTGRAVPTHGLEVARHGLPADFVDLIGERR